MEEGGNGRKEEEGRTMTRKAIGRSAERGGSRLWKREEGGRNIKNDGRIIYGARRRMD